MAQRPQRRSRLAWGFAALTCALAHACARPSASDAPTSDAPPDGPFIEILGVAQDAGVPQAACASANCESARADPSRVAYATSLALLDRQGNSYLFEATPDIRPQLDRVLELGEQRERGNRGRKLVDGIFVTHAHMGHYSGLLHLGFEAAHSQDIPIYGSAKMLEFLGSNQPWAQLLTFNNLTAKPVDAASGVTLSNELRVSAFSVPHRDELSDTLAWRIEGPTHTLLFMPDCDPWARWPARGFELEPMLEGVDILLVDATFYSRDELPGRDLDKIGHPFVTDTLARFGGRVTSGGLRVLLIHFNHSNPLLDPHGQARETVTEAGFELALRGMQIAL